MNIDNLNSFLKFGYFLNYRKSEILPKCENFNKSIYTNMSEKKLIDLGGDRLNRSIDTLFEAEKDDVVPISGGLDSRAILSRLLMLKSAREIHTYTFGSPGSLDFEIGNLVAKKTGTKHQSFDLSKVHYTQGELESISTRVDQQSVLFFHTPVPLIDELYKDASHWVGYMGDPIAGSHLYKNPSPSMKEAKRRFVERNTMNDSIDLTNGSDFSHLIEFNKKDSCHLTLDENLDFFNRQVKYVAPHVLLQGYSYKLPFLDLDFYNFMLGVRSKYRINKKLYKKILLRNYQNMFDLPVKENYGLSLNSTKLNIFLKKTIVSRLGNKELNVNYANFHKMYTANLNFRDLVKSNLIDLKNRGVVNWIDPLEILQKVSQTDSRYFNTILVLVSLEIHLKTGKEI